MPTHKISGCRHNNLWVCPMKDSRSRSHASARTTYLKNSCQSGQKQWQEWKEGRETKSWWRLKICCAGTPPWSQHTAKFSCHKYCERGDIDFLNCYGPPGTILENYFGRWSPTHESELPMQLGCTRSCEPHGKIQMYNPGKTYWLHFKCFSGLIM